VGITGRRDILPPASLCVLGCRLAASGELGLLEYDW